MERSRYEFVLEAEQPIAHSSGTIGNDSLVMRRKMRMRSGEFANVPIITGDTMRHGMREAAAYALLDAAGLLGEQRLSEAALRLLFAGGMVSGKSGGAVKLGDYRLLCEMVPSMALFGGCAQNRVVPGRLFVEDATVICTETKDFCPPWVIDFAGKLSTHRSYVEEVQRVRMDPMLQPQKRMLLSDGDQVAVNKRLESSEAASEAGDAIEKQDNKSTMMPRRHERVIQGALFSWSVEGIVNNDLEQDVFNVACMAFLANAQVGGKRGTGHGKLRVLAGNRVEMKSPARQLEELDTKALAPKVGQLFRAHVAERKDALKDFLSKVDA